MKKKIGIALTCLVIMGILTIFCYDNKHDNKIVFGAQSEESLVCPNCNVALIDSGYTTMYETHGTSSKKEDLYCLKADTQCGAHTYSYAGTVIPYTLAMCKFLEDSFLCYNETGEATTNIITKIYGIESIPQELFYDTVEATTVAKVYYCPNCKYAKTTTNGG